MNLTPDLRIWNVANDYQEAAELCHENDLGWPAAINAALSIEMYIKSLLSEQIIKIIHNDLAGIGFSKTKSGHPLLELYNKIEPSLQQELLTESGSVNPEIDLVNCFTKYNDIFTKARYRYEEGSYISVNSEVVEISSHMKKVVRNLAEKLHPKIVKAEI